MTLKTLHLINQAGLYGIFVHNFLDAVESYNDIRHGINFGAGVYSASGYLALKCPRGWEVYLGKDSQFFFQCLHCSFHNSFKR